MAYACRFCIARHGLHDEQVKGQPATWELAAEHVEREHRYPVRRAHETQEQAEYRVFMKYRKTLRRAAAIVAGLEGADKLVEIIERMGPIIQVHAVPTAQSAFDLIRKLP